MRRGSVRDEKKRRAGANGMRVAPDTRRSALERRQSTNGEADLINAGGTRGQVSPKRNRGLFVFHCLFASTRFASRCRTRGGRSWGLRQSGLVPDEERPARQRALRQVLKATDTKPPNSLDKCKGMLIYFIRFMIYGGFAFIPINSPHGVREAERVM